jgi:hypothetical protein
MKGGKHFRLEDAQELWKVYKRYSTSMGQVERLKETTWKSGAIGFDSLQKDISTINKTIKKR